MELFDQLTRAKGQLEKMIFMTALEINFGI